MKAHSTVRCALKYFCVYPVTEPASRVGDAGNCAGCPVRGAPPCPPIPASSSCSGGARHGLGAVKLEALSPARSLRHHHGQGQWCGSFAPCPWDAMARRTGTSQCSPSLAHAEEQGPGHPLPRGRAVVLCAFTYFCICHIRCAACVKVSILHLTLNQPKNKCTDTVACCVKNI